MANDRYKCAIRGLSSEELWKDRYCFIPMGGPCVYCGNYHFAYAAYVKSNGVLGVRYICRHCGHAEDIKRVDFVKAEMTKSTRKEVEARREMRGIKEGWPIYSKGAGA